MERTATCPCGRFAVTVAGDPELHGLCSCTACQRASGTAFTYAGYWPRSAVRRIVGRSSVWRRSSDSGRWFERHFCPICGGSVYGHAEFAPGMIVVAIGCFADPSFPPPAYAVWCAHKHPWVRIPDGCEEHERGMT